MVKQNSITFCQTDLPSISFCLFQDMKKEEQLCDVKINVQNHSFTAHRVVLAAAIPYFRSLFISADKEIIEKEISVEDLNPLALEALIDFAYTSKVTISMENVESLIDASHFLQLSQVHDSCVQFLSERVSVGNVVQMRSLGLRINECNLVEICNEYIRRNFEEFVKYEDFLNLGFSFIKEIISADSLNVGNEETVFESVIKWVRNRLQERETLFPELLSEVRLTLLPIEYLVDRVDSEELITSSKTCRDLVNDVKNYHLLPERKGFSHLKTHPRSSFKCCELYAVCSIGNSACSVYYFDVVRSVWLNVANTEVSCEEAGGVAVNGKIYMFLDKTVQTFDLRTREWKELTIDCEGSDGSAIVSYNDLIYFFGSSNRVLRKIVRCFDTGKNEWLNKDKMKLGRWDSGAAVLEDYIFITGGGDEKSSSNAVEKYNPSFGEFNDVAPMFLERDQHGCTALNGKIYVCGGRSGGGTEHNSAEVYDPTIDQWNFIATMRNKLYLFSLVSYKGKVYALDESEVEVYNVANNLWTKCNFSVPKEIRFALSIP